MGLYFAYGSNLWLGQMRDRCPDHRIVGHGILSGYRWIISSRGYANIVEATQDEVHGVVYEISESDEENLDKAEGVASGSYRKEWLKVVVNGVATSCLVYRDPTQSEGSPRDEYIRRINLGIEHAELPEDYVKNYIRKFVPSMRELISRRLDELETEIEKGVFFSQGCNATEWGGADVIIRSNMTPKIKEWQNDTHLVISLQKTQPRRRAVITPFSKELSWLFYNLKDVFEGTIDYISKYDFFGRLAQVAIDYAEIHRESIDCNHLLKAVLDEARRMVPQ